MSEQTEEVVRDHDDYELNHTDKLVGIFTEPVKTFSSIANFPLKGKDWVVPLLILIVVTIISSVLMMSNPIIKNDVIQKQQAEIQKMVDEGNITQQQADAQKNATSAFMEGPIFVAVQAVSITIGMFIVFFVVTGVFYLFVKFAMNGEGSFKGVMVAYGLPMYIAMIQVIVVVILALTMDKLVSGINPAVFLGMETKELGGFFLSKIDPLSIWFYSVFGIGLAKLFKSDDTKKYILMVLAVWLGSNIILFFIAQSMPMLGRFIGMG